MAEVKKTAVAKPTAKAVAAKAAEVKKEDVKTEAAAPVKEAVEKEAPKAAKKPAAKKTTKAAAKKTAKTTAEKETSAKTAGRKPAAKAVVHVQFSGKSYTMDDLVKSAKDVWEYDLNRKPADFKSVELYVKPEEHKAYYVINGEVSGDFNI